MPIRRSPLEYPHLGVMHLLRLLGYRILNKQHAVAAFDPAAHRRRYVDCRGDSCHDASCFNGKFRDECRGLEWFRSRAEAKVGIESWRRHAAVSGACAPRPMASPPGPGKPQQAGAIV